MMTIRLWIVAALLLALLIVRALMRPGLIADWLTARRHSKEYWLKHLLRNGPVPLSDMPSVADMQFPMERFRRMGLIDIEPGNDPVIHLSGYGRLLINSN